MNSAEIHVCLVAASARAVHQSPCANGLLAPNVGARYLQGDHPKGLRNNAPERGSPHEHTACRRSTKVAAVTRSTKCRIVFVWVNIRKGREYVMDGCFWERFQFVIVTGIYGPNDHLANQSRTNAREWSSVLWSLDTRPCRTPDWISNVRRLPYHPLEFPC